MDAAADELVGDNVPSTVTYDHTIEPRGLAAKTTDSVAGTFQATYDADGSVTSERLPGGYTLKLVEINLSACRPSAKPSRRTDGMRHAAGGGWDSGLATPMATAATSAAVAEDNEVGPAGRAK
ncbi:hypothetical protein ACWC9Q_38155 [Streptomyces sp. NPDC001142]